jgi:hypothetical protein
MDLLRQREVNAVAGFTDTPETIAAIKTTYVAMAARYTSSADNHTMVARIAFSILKLLSDGIPRSKRAFVAALADRYPKEEVELTLMRLAVAGQILAGGGKYTLPPAAGTKHDVNQIIREDCINL